MPNLTLNLEQTSLLETTLAREVDASATAKGQLPQRWKRCEDMYRLVEGTCRMQAVEGMAAYEIALARPKVKKAVGTVVDSLTRLYPWVQCIEPGGEDSDPINDEDTEKLLHELARSGGFLAAFKKAVLYAGLTNLGVIRIVADEIKGSDFKWIHPDKVIVYPAEFGTFAEAKTVGHLWQDMLYRVQERQNSGDYYQVPLLSDGQYVDQSKQARANFNKTESTPVVNPLDGPVELATVLHKCDLFKEGYKYYQCTYAVKQRKLLKCEEYLYETPNYFDVRFEDTEGEIYTGDSLMQTLQGAQLAYSDLFTMMIQGSMASAFPLVYESGGGGPLKVSSYGPATRIQSPVKLDIQVVQANMDPGVIPLMINKLEEVASSIAGISTLGTSANMPSGTTATAAAGFLEAQQESKDEYSQSVGPSVARMWAFLWEIVKKHPEQVFNALRGKATPLSPEALAKEYVFEVTGESGASNPQGLLNKLMFFKQIAMDPNSPYDPQKIDERIVQMLDLPFSTQGLMKDGPGRMEMTAIIAGLITGTIAPEEAAEMLGLTPEALMQLAMSMEDPNGSEPGSSDSDAGQSGMGGVPALPTGPTGNPPTELGAANALPV